MLWVDKHRPTALDKLDYHKDQAAQLARLAEAGDLPHMMFYGPSGAGKKTRIMALLRSIYGAGVEKVKLEHRPFKTPSGKQLEVTTVASNYHIEINPGDAGIYDRYVVQDIIKEMAAYNPLESSRSFKVVLLSEVDRLTKDAQAALRRTMEKYSATCRLILVCTSPSKVIEPLRSRCLGMRIAAPSQQEIMAVLAGVAAKEGLTLPVPLAAKIAAQSGRNLRRAVLMLEACKVQQYPFSPQQAVSTMDWEKFVGLLALEVLKEQSPKSLLACRARVYELLVNCVPADVVVKKVTQSILEKVPEAVKHEVATLAAAYEHRLQLGQKEVFHIEAYLAKVMATLKNAGWNPASSMTAGAGVVAAAGGAGGR